MKRMLLFSLYMAFFSVAVSSMTEGELAMREKMVMHLEKVSDVLPRAYLEEVFASPLLRIDSVLLCDLKGRKGKVKIFFDSLFSPWSVERGKHFLERYADTLRSVWREYGVPPEMATAMMRIESDLGENPGKYLAMNTYYTLYTRVYRSGRRRTWVLGELRALLEYCYQTFPHPSYPFFFTSSWAGAIGYCQFMPSNLHLAVDGNGDGVVNIAENMPDAIASAANFLEAHGYRIRPHTAVLRYIGGSMRTSGWYVRAAFEYARLIKK